jgi:hypothetical protein
MGRNTKTLTLWIDKELNLIESISFFDQLIKGETGKSFRKVQLSITDKSKKNWRLFSRSFGNNNKGLVKLDAFIEGNKEKKYEINFALESLLKNYYYKAIDIDMHLDYSLGENCTISFLFNEEENKNVDLTSIITKTFNYLNKNQVEIKYGFGFVMENKKMPGFFCSGIYTENLTEEEKMIVSLIADKDITGLINVPFSIQIINKRYVDLDNKKIKNLIRNNTTISLNGNIALINNERGNAL